MREHAVCLFHRGFRMPTHGGSDAPHELFKGLLTAALVALWFAGILPAQSAAESVKEAFLLLDDGSGAGRVEQPVQLVGILTSEPVTIADGEILAFFQDPTGGVSLIGPTASLTIGHFRRGDILRVTGMARYRMARRKSWSTVGRMAHVRAFRRTYEVADAYRGLISGNW